MQPGATATLSNASERLKQETVHVFTPIVRMFMLLISAYYVINTFGHFVSETGWEALYFASLSAISSLAAALYYFDLKDANSILKLEFASVVGNGLLLINLLFSFSTSFDGNMLVYFILMVFVFPMTGVSLRVSLLFSAVALGSLYAVILAYDTSYLQDYIYIGMASIVVALGGSLMLRRVILSALNAKLDAAQRKAEAVEAAERATKLAVTDNLTGLPNRRDFFRMLDERASEYEEKGETLAVLLIDLDGFKPVNDTYGHSTGDDLLITVGERLKEALSDDVYLARIGGDEFAAITSAETPLAAKAIGDKLCEAMRAPFNLGRVLVHVGATVGAATREDAGTSPSNLVEYADYALYNAKRSKKGTCKLFTTSDAGAMTHLFIVDQALRRCNLERELSVVYQPQFDMVQNRVTGFEALARWNSSELGKVNPDTFITVAETSGMISDVTQVLLHKAMTALKTWPSDVTLSFNLSVHDVLDVASIARVLEIVKDAGIEPSRICFEITETVMMGDIEKAGVALQKIVDAGHEVALDDFGTGYSNFVYLQKLPIHKIKIDRSFIRDISVNNQSRKMIGTLLQLSASLNKDCVVEGVETEAEFQAVRLLGGRVIQGYFCGKPMGAHDAEDLLSKQVEAEAGETDTRGQFYIAK